jgi:hypothetical protein
MIASLITESLIRNGIDTTYLHVRTTASIYIPKHRNISVDITHFLLIETSQATATVTVAPVQLENAINSGQQTKFTQVDTGV